MKNQQYERTLILKSLVLIIFTLLIFACKPSQNEEADNDTFETLINHEDNHQYLKEDIDDIIKNLPPPTDIPFFLEASGAPFTESLINPIENISSYKTTFNIAAINLGIYAVDIGYLISYNQLDGALNYMGKASELADHIYITSAYEVELLREIEKNIESRDTLIILLNSTIDKTNNFLRENDRTPMAVLVLTGGIIEGLYLSTEIISSAYKEKEETEYNELVVTLSKKVLEMDSQLANLSLLLESLEKEEFTDQLLSKLNSINSMYDLIAKENKDTKTNTISPIAIASLTKEIRELRSIITN